MLDRLFALCAVCPCPAIANSV